MTDLNDLNYDGLGENISSVIRNFIGQVRNTDDTYEGFQPIGDAEIDQIFRDDFLIQKIISKYPKSAKSTGYKLLNNKGDIVSENDVFVLEAFTEASIMGRKYGKAYLVFFDQGKKNIELSKKSKLKSFKIKFDLTLEDIFYNVDDEKVHKSKVFTFLGNRTYLKDINLDDNNYSDSVIQGLKKAFFNYTNSNRVAYYILANLSYLTMGIDGLGSKVGTDEGKKVVLERLVAVNMHRDISRILAYDKGKEDIGFVSQTFSGVSEVLADIKNILMTYSDYPNDQLFEDTPKQSLGSGISNQLIARMLWAARLKNWVEENWLSNYTRLFNTIMGEGYSIEIPFKVDMTELEKAEIENKGAERIKKLLESGMISINEARTGYKSDEYTLNIALDENFVIPNNEVVQTPESKSTDNSQTNQVEANDANLDASVKDSFWEEFANITEDDLVNVAESVLIPGA
jgi:Protein of unknown function (DUF1073)